MGRLPVWRHLVVLIAIFGLGAMALVGFIGSPRPDERYAQWQVVIASAGEPAIQVTETIDLDTGGSDRHGIRRLIPTDFGEPTDVTVTATDAPDDLQVSPRGLDVEVRVGDPDVTINGQYRYVLGYQLPDAQYAVGERLAVDLTGNLTLPVSTLRGTFTGFELSDIACYRGRLGAKDTCEIKEIGDGVYQAELHDVRPAEFVTIEGTVDAIVERRQVEIAPLVPVQEPDRTLATIAVIVSGALSALAVFLIARIRGRNVVYAGGPTDAALPPPGSTTSTTLVSDARLAELATTEFAPPRGVAPWEGAVALNERIDDDTVKAYISGLAANEAVILQPFGSALAISAGPRLNEASQYDQQFVYQLLSIANPFVTGTYDSRFASLMNNTKASLVAWIRQRQWWRRGGPSSSGGPTIVMRLFVPFFILTFFCGFGGVFVAFMRVFGVITHPVSAAVFAMVVCGLVALLMYRVLLPSRSAAGSAVALQTESFRRFLHASEAQHVEWAWQQGLLREYSAWAVALGEADAWSRALQVSTVPPQDYSMAPLMMYSFGPSFSQSSTAPSSNSFDGGSSGGGFSGGGSAGGGGGGGGGGSW